MEDRLGVTVESRGVVAVFRALTFSLVREKDSINLRSLSSVIKELESFPAAPATVPSSSKRLQKLFVNSLTDRLPLSDPSIGYRQDRGPVLSEQGLEADPPDPDPQLPPPTPQEPTEDHTEQAIAIL